MGRLILLHFSFVSPLQPAPANPYPSIHLAPEKMGCKYFGVSSYLLRLQCGSLRPINRVCLLSLNCLCLVFGGAATLFSLIKWCPPGSFCACVFLKAKIDKPGAALSECVCVCARALVIVSAVSITGAVQADSLVLNHSFYAQQATGKSSVLHIAARR